MNDKKFFKQTLPLFFIIIFLLFRCALEKSDQEKIIGNWEAHWETKPEESLQDLKVEYLNMNGQITFEDDGKVKITAYGFEGCIFSSDTLVNTLFWKLEDSVLRFIDSGDHQGLPYEIKKFSEQELHLLLLDDIKLTLRRN